MMNSQPNLERAVEALRACLELVVFTGAGISAESGIATYRDKLTGLWAQYQPEALETAKTFKENPALIWGWYLWRRAQFARAEPNAAHFAINRLASPTRKVAIVTQNIDDLHERSGSLDVIHLHGSLTTPKCFACHRPADLTAEQLVTPPTGGPVEPPRCKRCNGKMRPAIVWYGEDLPHGAWKSASSKVKACDVLISVGTSGVVMPAAELPKIALSSGATVIHVNTQDVALGEPNELLLLGRATETLSMLANLI